MLTHSHPALKCNPRLAHALDTGKVAVTFRKVTDDGMPRTMIMSRSAAAQAEVAPRGGVPNDCYRPNVTVVEFLPDGSTRLRSFYPYHVISWTVVSEDET